jgi:hypothetical protein
MGYQKDLDELFWNTFNELMELSAFQNSTTIGFDLIEEKYQAYFKSIEGKKGSRLEQMRYLISGPHNLGDKQSTYLALINKSIIIYACSIFDYYLNQSLTLLFLIYPKVLASEKKTVPYHQFILNNKDDLLKSIIEKEIYEISYKKIDERIKYLSHKFQLDFEYTEFEIAFFSHKINLNELVEAYAIRNIIIHNKSIVNKIFIENVTNSKYKIGDIITVDKGLVDRLTLTLLKSLTSIIKQIEMRYL